MISYAEKEVFPRRAIHLWRRAAELVSRVREGKEETIRCHELARAVAKCRPSESYDLEVVDGHYGRVEHSWLLLRWSSRVVTKATVRAKYDHHILDVYVPGSLPQVQLVDGTIWVAGGLYKEGDLREDIDMHMVRRLTEQMLAPDQREPPDKED